MTDEDISSVLAMTQAAGNAWMNGDFDGGYGAALTPREDASIYGPFGGTLTNGTRAWIDGARIGVRQFRNGQAKVTLLQSYASGDLLVLVLLEEQKGEIGGVPDQPWSLRVTQVYRRENGKWHVVHRHADPLVKRRTLPETAAIAREA